MLLHLPQNCVAKQGSVFGYGVVATSTIITACDAVRPAMAIIVHYAGRIPLYHIWRSLGSSGIMAPVSSVHMRLRIALHEK